MLPRNQVGFVRAPSVALAASAALVPARHTGGGLIAFIVGVGFTGGFFGGLKLAETDAVLHLLPRDEPAVPGAHAQRALLQ
jgi:hypothetical protein